MFVTGILAALRSKFQKGKVIGAMVTASHNQEEDNGVKLVDPMGEMLEQSWEEYAIWLANAEDFETLVSKISEIVKITSIDLSIGGTVVSARDTRSSAPKLLQALQDGIEVLDGTYNFYGFMTTPQLHYITRCLNTENTPQSYGVPTREGYYEKLSRAYKKVVGNKPRNSNLTVDCANGVGAIVLKEFQKYLGDEYVSITISHDATNNPCVLNHNSGADFVKVQQRLPKGTILAPNARACSFDGDGDRIVFYYVDGKYLINENKIRLSFSMETKSLHWLLGL
jgi:phosphoacetylglucosamine mutase